MILIPPSHHTTLSGMRGLQVKSFTRAQWSRGPRHWCTTGRLNTKPQEALSKIPTRPLGIRNAVHTSGLSLADTTLRPSSGSKANAGDRSGPKADLWDVLQGL